METRRERIEEEKKLRHQNQRTQSFRRRRNFAVAASVGTALGGTGLALTHQVAFVRADTTSAGVTASSNTNSNTDTDATTQAQSDPNVPTSQGYGDTAFVQALGTQARKLAQDNDLYCFSHGCPSLTRERLGHK